MTDEEKIDEVRAMALGNTFLLHYLLERMATLRDENGQALDVTLIFDQAIQALQDEGDQRGPAWAAAVVHLERLRRAW